ncbi:helix-turn-helix domain-containing protein [Sediminivirga luteola]|uniref:HTH cro/C1-type domain-containing protein n=1 Tax=Sediminivirga luteola TaxID=1774748 RepID=A0A8J2TVQ2_9MICO|nr:helix-turn-helix domain-containing protein [Sediminivirga luteola]MCI2265209.1 helix-turn-helix domain-containing protein [Sediminivirga luteola]GGA05165.1 hypothetical protein GCM10011333_04870 [Sediminivirga luteola]
MNSALLSTGPVQPAQEPQTDALSIGRKIRHFRQQREMTLTQLGGRVDAAPSQLSTIENGRREPSLPLLRRIAEALGTEIGELLDPSPVDERQALELELERTQTGSLYSSLGLPTVRSKALSHEALAAIVALQRQLRSALERRAATPEEARRANRELRDQMSRDHNYSADLEAQAEELLGRIGYADGPLSQLQTAEIARSLGFSLHYVPDLPKTTRSVTDQRNGRIYLGNESAPGSDPRAVVLKALASHVLGHATPQDYREFLAQRVEANYLAAAMLLPQAAAVHLLSSAKAERALSIEQLRDRFAVSYETAAHRFTNLATEHLGIPVHFMKVHSSGTIHKVYSNDGLPFPTDPLGSVEGQYACKRFTSRTVFGVSDRFSPYYQYTDTPGGTFWCTARVLPGSGDFSVSMGVPFGYVKWFMGRETPHRSTSRCPERTCCRAAPAELAGRWAQASWPAAKTHASLLAAVPPGAFPGVDTTEVYEFLERHSA